MLFVLEMIYKRNVRQIGFVFAKCMLFQYFIILERINLIHMLFHVTD